MTESGLPPRLSLEARPRMSTLYPRVLGGDQRQGQRRPIAGQSCFRDQHWDCWARNYLSPNIPEEETLRGREAGSPGSGLHGRRASPPRWTPASVSKSQFGSTRPPSLSRSNRGWFSKAGMRLPVLSRDPPPTPSPPRPDQENGGAHASFTHHTFVRASYVPGASGVT